MRFAGQSIFNKMISSRVLKIVVSAVMLSYAISRFGLTDTIHSIKNAEIIFLLAAGAAFMASGFAGAAQWDILLNFHNIKEKYVRVVSRYFTGLFFNFVLPGFVGGDIVRIYQTSKSSGKSTAALSSTLADRVVGFFVLISFSLGAFLFLPEGPSWKILPVTGFLFSILAVFTLIISYKPAGQFIESILGIFLSDNLKIKLKLLFIEMHNLTRSPYTLAIVLSTSVIIQLLRITVHFLCGRAVGIDAPFMYFAMFVPIMEIAASIPLSVGGVGVRETMGVALFSTVGIAKPGVVAYSLLATFTGFVCSIPGGIAFALSGKGEKK